MSTVTGSRERQLRRRRLERQGTQMSFWGATGMTWAIGIVFWVIYIAIQLVATLAVGLWGEERGVSISIGQAAPVYVFVMGIITVASLLSVHVISGGTRRSAIRGYLAASLLIGVTFAVTQTLFTMLAAWLAGVAGLEVEASPEPLSLVAGLTIAIAAGYLSGLCVAAGYRRLGGSVGTLVLPVWLAPGAGALWLLGALGGDGLIGFGIGATRWLAALGCLLIGAVMVWLLLRRLPIR